MKVTCVVTVILENMFGNIKSPVFTYEGIGEEECAVELSCLQMLNISLRKTFNVGTILVLTFKNQPTNQPTLYIYLFLSRTSKLMYIRDIDFLSLNKLSFWLFLVLEIFVFF